MITIQLNITQPINFNLVGGQQFEVIVTKLDLIQKTLKEIKMTEQEFLAVLTKVDTTTNKIGANLSTIGTIQQGEADTIQTIKTEVDALVAAQQNAGVSDAIVNATKAIADKLQASSDTSDAAVAALQLQVPVLQGIAAAGTPVVPPPPPDVTPSA